MPEKLYILAVDDEEHIIEVYKDILAPKEKPKSRRLRSKSPGTQKKQANYHLETATSGEEMVEIVRKFFEHGKRFSVGFFDMRMPGGIDGLETIRQIMDIDPDINCVVVTADTDRPTKEMLGLFRDPSQFVYLNKPFNTPEIAQMALALSTLWKTKRQSEYMLDSLVGAAVLAVESRDPTTSGHSERVATLTVELAKAVDRSDGIYNDQHFERHELDAIRYASLLHDFGKIGVREHVLVKAKKLYPKDLEKIALKLEIEALKGSITEEKRQKWWENILEANQPSILASAIQLDLETIYNKGLLTDEEFHYLCIPKGTLTNAERKEIESHVTSTYNFLSAIEWTEEFQKVPEIAWAHHEKIDGSGYPRGIRKIPIESRMMAISDIFDALTASDRPYKSAVPLERALDILKFEVNGHKIDEELYRIFLESKIYQSVLNK